MANSQITFYVKSGAFNGTTWDLSLGGPMRCEMSFGGRPLNGWTGDAFWAQLAVAVDGRVQIRLFLADIKQTLAPNTKSTFTVILEGKGANSTLAFVNMVYIGEESVNQSRAATGEGALVFEHESADGTTFPMS